MSASKDPLLAALKGLRQYYLYVAVTSNGGGMGATSPIPGLTHNPAGEMKLDLISDLLEDIDFGQTVIYCANIAIQEALIYKLSSKGIEALGLNREMNTYTRQQTLAKFRSPSSQFGTHTMIGSATFAQPGGFVGVAAGSRTRKALVVCDLAVNPKDVHQIPLILFYDMPRSVEEYKEKISCAAAGSLARPSVCVNVVTASGGPRGDVEMLRTLECHLGCKMAELPMDSKQILNF
jgi:superfamily II DNA/RNA helicase